MQRLYVMFPDRGPGLGLLWLRLCVAGGLLAGGSPAGVPGLMCLAAIGLLLPLALLMLGPGAYSLDARLFGRRLLQRRPPPNG
jgi:hypothetical protein